MGWQQLASCRRTVASLVHSRFKLSTVVLACLMISNRFGATVSICAGVPGVGAGGGATNKHKLLGVRADFYNIIILLQSNTCVHGM